VQLKTSEEVLKMAKQIPIDVTQDRDGTYLVRLTIADAPSRRYADVAEVWRALDALDDPYAAEAALAA
jgi:hypothetical protein